MTCVLQHYSRGRDNLVLAPFGVATSVAMMLEGLQGRAADEITTLFRLQAKGVRQQLRRGFKMILDAFGVSWKKIKCISFMASNQYRGYNF